MNFKNKVTKNPTSYSSKFFMLGGIFAISMMVDFFAGFLHDATEISFFPGLSFVSALATAFLTIIFLLKVLRTPYLRLNEDLRRFKKAVDQSPATVVITDPSGAIQYVNQKFCDVTGYTYKEALGENPRILKSGEHSEATYKGLWHTILSGETWTGEFHNKKKNGELYWESASISPVIDDKGKIINFMAIKEDITERKALEERARKARQAALDASRAKSDFVANMSHEIRTPLNGVLGMTELVLNTDLSEEQRYFISTVHESAKNLLVIINDVLDFSKIEARKLEISPIAFSVKDHLSSSMRNLAIRAQEKDLELMCRIAPDIPSSLKGDPGRIAQVVSNLVGNAIKFTERGEIVVDVSLQEKHEAGVELEYKVRDTGIGIPKDKQDKVLEPFTQADNSTSRSYGGTGLGLAISTELVRLMGGHMWIESQEGKGTTVHFTVKCDWAASEATSKKACLSKEYKDLRVLVVDDNQTNRKILSEMLRSWGMSPFAVESGKDALKANELARRERKPFDLILTDCHMPEMDGFELAERIQGRVDSSNSEVLMMLTSGGREGDLERCREIGISNYLLKPISQSDLFDAIATAMGDHNENPEKKEIAESAQTNNPIKILLAEDNLVNQKVAKTFLTKRGHQVVVVGNGEEAVEILEKTKFDVVLMDLQMPVLDGFGAVMIIREEERLNGSHIPIIAMTAHAMKEDEEKCYEAGMDGYISKPIDSEKLIELVESFHKEPRKEDMNSDQKNHKSSQDLNQQLLERFGGDADLLRELVQLFLKESSELIDAIEVAVQSRDSDALFRAAHTLKGAISNFGAQEIVDELKEIEMLGREANLLRASEKYSSCKPRLENFTSQLGGMLN